MIVGNLSQAICGYLFFWVTPQFSMTSTFESEKNAQDQRLRNIELFDRKNVMTKNMRSRTVAWAFLWNTYKVQNKRAIDWRVMRIFKTSFFGSEAGCTLLCLHIVKLNFGATGGGLKRGFEISSSIISRERLELWKKNVEYEIVSKKLSPILMSYNKRLHQIWDLCKWVLLWFLFKGVMMLQLSQTDQV